MTRVMLDEVFKIIGLLTDLFKYREERSQRIFDKLIEPTFAELLLIHKNYLEMFEKVRSMLPSEEEGEKKSRKKLQEAYKYLSEKRIEFEPARTKLRALRYARRRKENERDIFIASIVDYLSWTGNVPESASSSLKGEIHAAVARYSYPPPDRRTDRHGTEQLRIKTHGESFAKPTAHDLDKYVSVLLDEHRRKFARAAEAYAAILVKVRGE